MFIESWHNVGMMIYFLMATVATNVGALVTLNRPLLSELLLVASVLFQTGFCAKVMLSPDGWLFNAQNAVLLISWVANLMVFVAQIKLHTVRFIGHVMAILVSLWIFLLPINAVPKAYSWQMDLHIMLSVLSIGVLFVSSILALSLGSQIRRLKKNLLSVPKVGMSSLLKNEEKLFRLVLLGWLLLSCALISGMLFHDYFAQGLGHKVTFSLLAWVLFGLLIFGRISSGWRGQLAIKLNLLAMLLLTVGYIGSYVVLDYLQ